MSMITHDRDPREMARRVVPLAVAFAAGLAGTACGAEGGGTSGPIRQPEIQQTAVQGETMKVRLRVGQTVRTATLVESAAARDFASQLPLTLTLEDYASTEKVADLPRNLSGEGAPDGHDASVGDIAYYAPWGNLAIYYRDFGYSRGLIHLGSIDAGAEAFAAPGPLQVTIERAE